MFGEDVEWHWCNNQRLEYAAEMSNSEHSEVSMVNSNEHF